MLSLVRIVAGCGVALIMIEFVVVDAFGADFILIVVTAIGPFKSNTSTTFNVTAGKDTIVDSAD